MSTFENFPLVCIKFPEICFNSFLLGALNKFTTVLSQKVIFPVIDLRIACGKTSVNLHHLFTRSSNLQRMPVETIFTFLRLLEGFYWIFLRHSNNPAGMYLFKVNSGNNKTICKICSKLTIKTLERCQGSLWAFSIIDFERVNAKLEGVNWKSDPRFCSSRPIVGFFVTVW